MPKRATVTIENIDTSLLRRQVIRLAAMLATAGSPKSGAVVGLLPITPADYDILQGILNLLEAVQDKAEETSK